MKGSLPTLVTPSTRWDISKEKVDVMFWSVTAVSSTVSWSRAVRREGVSNFRSAMMCATPSG